MAERTELVLMDKERVYRSLIRMAYQIVEDNRSGKEIVLLGIDRRGFITAGLLGGCLEEIYKKEIPVKRLSLKDGSSKEDPLELETVEERYLILVDDVIFSGKTMFTALTTLFGEQDFEEIHTAVLVDRGHRKFPIQAQFSGLELSTKLKEHVSVVVENDTIESVVLELSE